MAHGPSQCPSPSGFLFPCERCSASVVLGSAVRSFVQGLDFPIVYNGIVKNGIYGEMYTLAMHLKVNGMPHGKRDVCKSEGEV